MGETIVSCGAIRDKIESAVAERERVKVSTVAADGSYWILERVY